MFHQTPAIFLWYKLVLKVQQSFENSNKTYKTRKSLQVLVQQNNIYIKRGNFQV